MFDRAFVNLGWGFILLVRSGVWVVEGARTLGGCGRERTSFGGGWAGSGGTYGSLQYCQLFYLKSEVFHWASTIFLEYLAAM